MVASKYVVFPQARLVEIWEEDITAPESDEVLCRADKSLISIGTELSCLNGIFDAGTNWSDWVQYPFRPGYSMVGEVIEVGDSIDHIKVGDRLATYDFHQQYFKLKPSDFSEGRQPYRIPDDITSEEATWRSLACTTQNAVRRAKFEFGESVAVIGLGILGQLTLQYLVAAGAKHIIAIDKSASRLERAQQHGATHTLKMDVKNAVDEVRDITDGWMLDVVFDVTGVPAAFASAIQLVRPLGRLVLLGDTPTPTQQHLGPGVVSNSISILGIHGYAIADTRTPFTPWTAKEMSHVFFTYLQRDAMRVKNLITHRMSLIDAPSLYLSLLEDRTGALGIILDWTQV